VTKTATFSIDESCKIIVQAPFALPDRIVHHIENIWANEKARRGSNLKNNTMYSLVEYKFNSITLQAINYKEALARRRAPELFELGLTVRPAAVAGILTCADGLVLGLRSKTVISDKGYWETAPAGGLANRDPKIQILEELEEELGLKRSQVTVPLVLGLVENVETGVIDIVLRLKSKMTARDIHHSHKNYATNEYEKLAIISPNDLKQFLKKNKDYLIPVLQPILNLGGIIQNNKI